MHLLFNLKYDEGKIKYLKNLPKTKPKLMFEIYSTSHFKL